MSRSIYNLVRSSYTSHSNLFWFSANNLHWYSAYIFRHFFKQFSLNNIWNFSNSFNRNDNQTYLVRSNEQSLEFRRGGRLKQQWWNEIWAGLWNCVKKMFRWAAWDSDIYSDSGDFRDRRCLNCRVWKTCYSCPRVRSCFRDWLG